jgi:hypothetical protein
MPDNETTTETRTGYRSLKPLWWTLAIVAFVALCAVTLVSTRHSDRAVQQAQASGQGQGIAYSPTTGQTTPAGAAPSALGSTTPDTPHSAPVPGPVAQGADVPPAPASQLNR